MATVHCLQVALAHDQHMPLGIHTGLQRFLQLIDEVFTVGQLRDGIAVGLQLQAFNALCLRIRSLCDTHTCILNGVGH